MSREPKLTAAEIATIHYCLDLAEADFPDDRHTDKHGHVVDDILSKKSRKFHRELQRVENKLFKIERHRRGKK